MKRARSSSSLSIRPKKLQRHASSDVEGTGSPETPGRSTHPPVEPIDDTAAEDTEMAEPDVDGSDTDRSGSRDGDSDDEDEGYDEDDEDDEDEGDEDEDQDEESSSDSELYESSSSGEKGDSEESGGEGGKEEGKEEWGDDLDDDDPEDDEYHPYTRPAGSEQSDGPDERQTGSDSDSDGRATASDASDPDSDTDSDTDIDDFEVILDEVENIDHDNILISTERDGQMTQIWPMRHYNVCIRVQMGESAPPARFGMFVCAFDRLRDVYVFVVRVLANYYPDSYRPHSLSLKNVVGTLTTIDRGVEDEFRPLLRSEYKLDGMKGKTRIYRLMTFVGGYHGMWCFDINIPLAEPVRQETRQF